MKVAFLGLGNMGRGMAHNLLQAGHQLTVWNRSKGKGEELVKAGAKEVNTPAEAVREAEAAFTMVADDPAIEKIVFGDDGMLKALPKGGVHISASTISVALSKRLNDAHHQHGQQYLSAPVFGRPEAAAAAKLFVVVAGAGELIEKYQPLLSTIGQQTFVMGTEPPMANAVKLSGNFLIATVIESFAEALTLVRKYGVDPKQYAEMLTSSLFNAPVYKNYAGLVVNQKFEPAGFKLTLGLKDIRLALAAGEGVNVPLPIASLIRDHFLQAVANGMADKDWSAMSQVVAMNAGLK
jgi:3-hydroxyisobutyrate dehydrogenase-like beta-hydroxyacid dehydrogenase